jgi:hypothetical protein
MRFLRRRDKAQEVAGRRGDMEAPSAEGRLQ